MNQHSIAQKYQPAFDELILGFVSGSTQSVFGDFDNITNTCIPEPPRSQDIKYFHFADKINGFSNLLPNWDSYNADAISKDAIIKALDALNYLNNKGFLSGGITINIFPMRDGGIQFEFDEEVFCGELEINHNGELTFILFDDDGSIVEQQQLFELSELSTILEETEYA